MLAKGKYCVTRKSKHGRSQDLYVGGQAGVRGPKQSLKTVHFIQYKSKYFMNFVKNLKLLQEYLDKKIISIKNLENF